MNNYTEALSIEMKIFIIDIFLCTNIIIFRVDECTKKFKKNSTMSGYDRISIRQQQ